MGRARELPFLALMIASSSAAALRDCVPRWTVLGFVSSPTDAAAGLTACSSRAINRAIVARLKHRLVGGQAG